MDIVVKLAGTNENTNMHDHITERISETIADPHKGSKHQNVLDQREVVDDYKCTNTAGQNHKGDNAMGVLQVLFVDGFSVQDSLMILVEFLVDQY